MAKQAARGGNCAALKFILSKNVVQSPVYLCLSGVGHIILILLKHDNKKNLGINPNF